MLAKGALTRSWKVTPSSANATTTIRSLGTSWQGRAFDTRGDWSFARCTFV